MLGEPPVCIRLQCICNCECPTDCICDFINIDCKNVVFDIYVNLKNCSGNYLYSIYRRYTMHKIVRKALCLNTQLKENIQENTF